MQNMVAEFTKLSVNVSFFSWIFSRLRVLCLRFVIKLIIHSFLLQEAHYYYKDVNCSEMQVVEQELERLLPGKRGEKRMCLMLIHVTLSF